MSSGSKVARSAMSGTHPSSRPIHMEANYLVMDIAKSTSLDHQVYVYVA